MSGAPTQNNDQHQQRQIYLVMSRYIYSPLEAGNDIRLIRLWPAAGPWVQKIEFDIFHTDKTSNPLYEALSYVWGSSERTDIAYVTCGSHALFKSKENSTGAAGAGSTLPITSNLVVALRNLRDSQSPRVLWVDAICINQEDVPERSQEVSGMSAIYNNAQQTVVWLGPAGQDSRLALDTLGRIAEDLNFNEQDNFAGCWPGSWTRRLEEDSRNLQTSCRRWVAIRDLLRRTWFTRLWVFQEIALSSISIVTVGTISMNWSKFRLGIFWIWRMTPRLNELNPSLKLEDIGTNHIRGFLEVTREDAQIGTSLLGTLYFTRHLSCFDDRDRYFAIRSLLPLYEQKLIVPNYTKTVQEVYTDTIRAVIEEYEGLNPVSLCAMQASPSIKNLPSWVPDISYCLLERLVPSECFAAGFSKAFYSFGPDNELNAQGVEVTKVAKVVSSPHVENLTNDELYNMVRRAWELLPSSVDYIAGGTRLDAFLDVIVCGRTAEKMNTNVGEFSNVSERKEYFQELWVKDKASSRPGTFAPVLAQDLKRCFLGRSFFTTSDGQIGMGPELAQSGDIVAIILGCCTPLLLRPTQQDTHTYRVVGDCYIAGMMDTEALLGPLPAGWSRKYAHNASDRAVILYKNGSTTTQDDPRASAFPQGWRNRFGTKDNQLVNEPDYGDEMGHLGRIWWDNLGTGQRTLYDPRLTPDLLRARGVDMVEITLV
ncbi:hypothetical protein VTL71DRAFT_3426 [Oculimacula yallundae]|uniref:Heterokaryon incompatibility domain-containing protein n=1 Tax=Oculimacula yallundae TaxID=86028 RepID=A0ABR4C747_9HELO